MRILEIVVATRHRFPVIRNVAKGRYTKEHTFGMALSLTVTQGFALHKYLNTDET